MLRPWISSLLCLTAAAGLLLGGCSSKTPLAVVPKVTGMAGSLHGGQQPISGSTIQVYAVGGAGDGSAATPLLASPLLTDANGSFLLAGLFSCPSPSTLVYITARGGSPAAGMTNPGIALMAALGPCGSLGPSTFININEVTAVAAVYALLPYMSSYSAIGSGAGDAADLAAAFELAGYFANTTTGSAPGLGVPANETVPVAQINTIANLMSACVNSAGGVSGDSSLCGRFYALTQPSGAPAVSDALAALLNLADHTSLNTSALYALIPPTSPFQPAQTILPFDFSVRMAVASAFTVTPSPVVFAPAPVAFSQPAQTITVTNGTSAPVNIQWTIMGDNSGDFFFANAPPVSQCSSTVAAHSMCTFTISFVPSALGARMAYFVMGNGSENPRIEIPLLGSGVANTAGPVTLTPASLVFTDFNSAQTLTLTNQGVTPLSINSIDVSGTFYVQSNNCGSSVAASSSCSINVSAIGYSSDTPATLTVLDDAVGGPQTVGLSFSGLGPVSLPTEVDFGHWAVGAMGVETLPIMGTGASGTFNFTITGTNATDFSFAQSGSVLSTSCYFNYRVGQPCLLDVFYRPSATGARGALVSLAGGGTFPIQGTGDPAGVDFDLYQWPSAGNPSTLYGPPITTFAVGTTPVGRPVASSFAIQNTGTVAVLSLNAPVISGPDAAAFSVTVPACSSVCMPAVTFTPAGTGSSSATLTYTDMTNTVTRTLALTGVGEVPAPVLSAPTALIFSNVAIGTVSAPQSITVSAYQNHPIQASLTSTYSGGPQPFVFSGADSCASTPCTLSIAYAPTASNAGNANVYVVATDTTSATSGSIQAYGQVAPLAYVSFSPGDISFGPQALHTASAAQTVTLTNFGSTVLMLGFSVPPRGGFSTPDYSVVNHCPVSLAINASCTVDVSFAPVSVTGTLSNYLVITGAQYTQYVSLNGTSF